VHPEKVALVVANAPDAGELSRLTGVFKLLGDPTRTRLLYALLEAGELCVCDLAASTGRDVQPAGGSRGHRSRSAGSGALSG
jgi:DNA-binding transcriptional ArsR family regulator